MPRFLSAISLESIVLPDNTTSIELSLNIRFAQKTKMLLADFHLISNPIIHQFLPKHRKNSVYRALSFPVSSANRLSRYSDSANTLLMAAIFSYRLHQKTNNSQTKTTFFSASLILFMSQMSRPSFHLISYTQTRNYFCIRIP